MPRNRELLAVPRRAAGPDRRVAPSAWSGGEGSGGLRDVPARDRLSRAGAGGLFRSRPRGSIRRFRPSAGRSSWCRCPMRATRSTPPMRAGARSTMRSTAPTPISREGELAPGKGFNQQRGAAVIARTMAFLDEAFPLTNGSHARGDQLRRDGFGVRLMIEQCRRRRALAHSSAIAGYADRPPWCCGTTACTSCCSDRPRQRVSAQTQRRGCATSSSRAR